MKFYKTLYFRVLVGTILGVLLGILDPDIAVSMKVLGESFIDLVKMLIGPIIFCTVVLGLASSGNAKKAGRVGIKALAYFEVMSTLALILGLLVGNLMKPGEGFHVDSKTLDISSVQSFAEKAHSSGGWIEILRRIIPKTALDAFTGSGDLLQVLLIALLFGLALGKVGEKAKPVREFIEGLSALLFRVMNFIMQLAPIGAFGAMAFTIGAYGLKSFGPLLSLMGAFYLTCVLFLILVLGTVSWFAGFNFFSFLNYIREEILLVLGTSSSESALVPLMDKLERLGCTRSTVGLVVPAGYSFNLDGTNIYLTLAVLFVAQALDIPLSIEQQITVLGVAMISSKGASGVTGAGFITLAATLSAVPVVPVAGLALILGIDRFMSEARAITNVIGNGVATILISRWEGELDVKHLRRTLREHRTQGTVLS